MPPFRVVALLSAFNEEDVISRVIEHLVDNGIQAYLLDNHSTDETVKEASRWLGKGLLGIESFPPGGEPSSNGFSWGRILRRKEELSREIPADWFIHHDADEIRESPWPGFNLRDAIQWVDSLGYSCINFRVLNFPPLDDGFRRGNDLKTYFTHYEPGAEFDLVQVKCWKANPAASLRESGGHDVTFEGRRLFPIPFLLRHYPVRSQQHGTAKVFTDRKPRFLDAERQLGWHRQYDGISGEHSFLRDPETLTPFDLDQVRLDLLRPDAELERELQKLRDHVAAVERDRDSLRAGLDSLGQKLEQANLHVAAVEADREGLRGHLDAIRQELERISHHAAAVEADRDELRRHIASAAQELEGAHKHGAALAADRENLSRQLDLHQRHLDESHRRSEALGAEQAQLREQIGRLTTEVAASRNTWHSRADRLFRRLRGK